MPLTEKQLDTYQDTIALIGDMFLNFEKQFEEFDSFVPYQYNVDYIGKIRSLRLYSLLQGINSGVEAVGKLLINILETDLEKNITKEEGFFTTLDQKGMLSFQKVALVSYPLVLSPFDLSSKVPPWWTAYNKTKHELQEGVNRSTIENVILALGGLLSLLYISRSILVSNESEQVLDSNNWHDFSDDFKADYERLKYSSMISYSLDQGRREFLESQQRKYKSSILHPLSVYGPKHSSVRKCKPEFESG